MPGGVLGSALLTASKDSQMAVPLMPPGVSLLEIWRPPSVKALISSQARHSLIPGFTHRSGLPAHGTTRSEGVSTKLLLTSIMVLQVRCWAFPSMFCYGQQVSLKHSQKPPSRNLDHGGAQTLLAMILEINIG